MPKISQIGPKGKQAIVEGTVPGDTIILLPGNDTGPAPPPLIRARPSVDLVESSKHPVTVEFAQWSRLSRLAREHGIDRSTLVRLGIDLVLIMLGKDLTQDEATRLYHETIAIGEAWRERAARRQEIRRHKEELGDY